MDQAEQYVLYWAKRYSCRTLPAEDLAQEIRITMLRTAAKFDPDGRWKWSTVASKRAKFSAIDACRKYGITTRQGNQKRVALRPLTDFELGNDSEGNHPEASDFGDHESEVEWADLGELVKTESIHVQAAYGFMSGKTMKTVAEELGRSEPWVSLSLGKRTGVKRLEHLIGVKR